MVYDFQKLVIELRNKLVISQTKLATMLGVSFASVNRWERGHYEPNIKVKRKIIELCKDKRIKIYNLFYYMKSLLEFSRLIFNCYHFTGSLFT